MKRTRKESKSQLSRFLLRRSVALVLVFIILFTALGVKLAEIQIVKHDEYEKAAIEQQTRDTIVTATRGTIYDRNGQILAVSASTETVVMNPKQLRKLTEDADIIAEKLAEILNLKKEDIYAKTQLETTYTVIARKIETETSQSVRAFLLDPNGDGDKSDRIKSVWLDPDVKRYYPRGTLAANIIGFVNVDNKGLEGLESEYNSYLTGTNGRVVRLTNSYGTDIMSEMMFTDYENYIDSQSGDDITLTIDANIQYIVERQLRQAVLDYGVQKGAGAIAMNPKTGDILAMASYGKYGEYDLNDPRALSDEIEAEIAAIEDNPETEINEQSAARTNFWAQKWRNTLVSDGYEPGSTFKTITLAMALEEGAATPESYYYCAGVTNDIPGRGVPLHCNNSTAHGSQTLAQAVKNSCNVAFAHIGMAVGAEKFYDYLRAFGFMDKTGIDIPGEETRALWSDKVFKDPKNQSQLASASYGQTFNITPIQLITAISACINGGTLYRPHIVSEISAEDGTIIESYAPEAVRQVVSAETSAIVREMLEGVVADGSGRNAKVTGYRVGGKTGTSRKTVEEIATGKVEYWVSFVGFAPADDPEIVILLILDTPSASSGVSIYGSTMAAPVVGRMLGEILPYLGVQPQYTDTELEHLNTTVPKVVNKSPAEAQRLITAARLDYKIVGNGDTVTAQLPNAATEVTPGSKVTLYLGETPASDEVQVPDLSGRSFASAKAALEAKGFFISSSGIPTTNSAAVVSVQSVAAGESARYGSVINVTLVLMGNEIEGVF